VIDFNFDKTQDGGLA